MKIRFRSELGNIDEVESDSVHTVGEQQAIMWVGINPVEPEILVVTLFPGGQYARGPYHPITGLPIYFVKA